MVHSIQLPDRETMYRALVDRDSEFEGVFFAAIKTTGIFCRPTCHARKPKPENVEYFPDVRSSMAAGYRACKICHPLQDPGSTPDWIAALISELEQTPSLSLKAQDLRDRGLDPARVRRWFQKTHGMTFHAYQRMQRINQAFNEIRDGKSVTQTAIDQGYESLSGFGHSFKKTTGASPLESRELNIVSISRITTPLGSMMVGANDNGVCLLEFGDRRMLETQLKRVRQRLKSQTLPGENQFTKQLKLELTEYFSGMRKRFEVPLVLVGTPFQEKVWNELLTIPHGETRSYGQLAAAIHQPTAVRAVARANGDNRLAILIPCHRIIGADGKLTGYGGGLWRKEKLLQLEKGAIENL